jgi:phosphoribosylformylglycinamidine cyclo-ligase
VDPSSWPRPAWCAWLQRAGAIPEEDLRQAFNLGIGMIAVCDPEVSERLAAEWTRSGEKVFAVGEVVAGARSVEWKE